MTNRECRLYYRKLRQGIRRHNTNNYKKLHGECIVRANTLFKYGKKHRNYRRVGYFEE